MTIVVAYKYAANPQDSSLAPDGRIDWSRAKETVSEYDPIAIQVARQVADGIGAEVLGVTVGTANAATSMAKKAALSRGLDRAVIVADETMREWSPTRVGAVLAALVRRTADADIVFTGDASVDEGAQLMPTLIAGYLGWPCFLEVSSVAKTGDGWRLVQNCAGGSRTIEVTGPVVAAVATDAAAPKAPGMKDILAAGKKPAEVVTLAELDYVDSDLAVTAQSCPPATARKHEIFGGENAPAELVSALRSAGLV